MIHPLILEDLAEIVSCLDCSRLHGRAILISGASGFLPAYMVESLLYFNETRNGDCRVIGIVRDLAKAKERFRAYSGRPDLVLLQADVSRPFEISERCDLIIHAASPASPKFFGTDPVGIMRANILGTHQLLELARTWGSEGFLLFSSGEVYGQVRPDQIPSKETDYGQIDILNPRSCYAESKRASETLAVSYLRQFGVPCRIVRPFHTYGPGMALDDGRVFADFVRDIVTRRNLVLRSDGKAVRAFCYLADAVRGFFTVLTRGESGQAYNVGNPAGALRIAELAELLVSLFPELGLKVERAEHPAAGYLPSQISVNIPDISRLAALGWQPRYSPEDGFTRTIRSFSDH